MALCNGVIEGVDKTEMCNNISDQDKYAIIYIMENKN